MYLDYDIVQAIAQDAANDNMRKHNRTRWSEEDYNIAAEVFNDLWPLITEAL